MEKSIKNTIYIICKILFLLFIGIDINETINIEITYF